VPLQAYTLPTLQVWINIDGGRRLHMSLTHLQKHFHHLGALLNKANKFTIGSFKFQFRSRGDFENYAEFSCEILYEVVTQPFHLVLVDATVDCSPRSCLNFVEFIWSNIKTFAFIKYAIVCILKLKLQRNTKNLRVL